MKEGCCNNPGNCASKSALPAAKPFRFLGIRPRYLNLILFPALCLFTYYKTLQRNKIISNSMEFKTHAFSKLLLGEVPPIYDEILELMAKQHSKVILDDAFYYNGVCKSDRDDLSEEGLQLCKKFQLLYEPGKVNIFKDSRALRDFYFGRYVVLPKDAEEIMGRVRELKERQYPKD